MIAGIQCEPNSIISQENIVFVIELGDAPVSFRAINIPMNRQQFRFGGILLLRLFPVNNAGEGFAINVEYSGSGLFVAAGLGKYLGNVFLFHVR